MRKLGNAPQVADVSPPNPWMNTNAALAVTERCSNMTGESALADILFAMCLGADHEQQTRNCDLTPAI